MISVMSTTAVGLQGLGKGVSWGPSLTWLWGWGPKVQG